MTDSTNCRVGLVPAGMIMLLVRLILGAWRGREVRLKRREELLLCRGTGDFKVNVGLRGRLSGRERWMR